MVGSEWLGAGGWCRRALVCVPKKKQSAPFVAVFFFSVCLRGQAKVGLNLW